MRIDDIPNVLDITECMELLDLQHYIFSHKIRRDIYESFVKRKKKFINTYFPKEIQVLYPCSMMMYPLIPFQKRFFEMDYYSKVRSEYMEYPITISITPDNIPFIIITYYEYNFNRKKRTQKSIVVIQRSKDYWSATSDYEHGLNSHDGYRMYYMWYDKNKKVLNRSQTNDMISNICKGTVIYANNIYNDYYYEYYI